MRPWNGSVSDRSFHQAVAEAVHGVCAELNLGALGPLAEAMKFFAILAALPYAAAVAREPWPHQKTAF